MSKKTFIDSVLFLRRTLKLTVLVLVILATLFPLFWIVINSLKFSRDILSANLFIFEPTLEHYRTVFFAKGSHFPRYLLNSITISLSSTIGCVIIGSLAAYSFSRFSFFRNLDRYIMGFLLFVRMIFPIALAIPFFVLMQTLELYDTIFAIILAHMVINVPFAVWMMKAFFDGLPQDMEEAALIDGCSRLGVMWRITLPLVAPGLAASSVFVYILSWDDFLFPAVLSASPKSMTLPIGLANFVQENIIEWANMSAGATFYMIPIFIFTFLVQKQLIKGFTLGGFGK